MPPALQRGDILFVRLVGLRSHKNRPITSCDLRRRLSAAGRLGRAVRAVAIRGGFLHAAGLTELGVVVLETLAKPLLESQRVFGTTQTQIREVVKKEAEAVGTVGLVLHGVEDVRVPELVDLSRRHDRLHPLVGHVFEVERKKPLVLDLDPVGIGDGPPWPILVVDEFELDRFEIKVLNMTESFIKIHDSTPLPQMTIPRQLQQDRLSY